MPALVDIIRAPEAHSPVLLEGALDMLAVLLAPSAPEQAAAVHAAASSHVMALALHQDDAGILQSCSEYLRCVTPNLHQPHASGVDRSDWQCRHLTIIGWMA